jgi:hypothetical protein
VAVAPKANLVVGLVWDNKAQAAAAPAGDSREDSQVLVAKVCIVEVAVGVLAVLGAQEVNTVTD